MLNRCFCSQIGVRIWCSVCVVYFDLTNSLTLCFDVLYTLLSVGRSELTPKMRALHSYPWRIQLKQFLTFRNAHTKKPSSANRECTVIYWANLIWYKCNPGWNLTQCLLTFFFLSRRLDTLEFYWFARSTKSAQLEWMLSLFSPIRWCEQWSAMHLQSPEIHCARLGRWASEHACFKNQ